jgi:hypothetical protein
MHISPSEAEEALEAIQKIKQKTLRSIAGSGAHIFLIVTGVIWLIGFLATQFLTGEIVAHIWIVTSILGTVVAILLGIQFGRQMSTRVHNPTMNATAIRGGIFWLFLLLFAIATIVVARPTDGKQITMLIILFSMLGQLSMGLWLTFSAVWWALPITALTLVGYFLLPDYFYLWMAVLVGGGMIFTGLYIRLRW